MLKADKERIVEELAERLQSSESLIVTDYRGLSMTEIDGLRGELLKHGARYSVVKNTLTRRAAEAAGAESLLAFLEGPTAIAFLDADGDPVAVAKALAAAARETRVLEIRGGLLSGETISETQVQDLAKLPPADVLRAQLAGAIVGPLTTVVGLFNAPLRDLVGVIDARIEQRRAEGDGSEAEAEVAAEAPALEEAPAEAAEVPAAETEEAPAAEASEAPVPEAEEAPAVDEPANRSGSETDSENDSETAQEGEET